jgi:hypothetical protein
MDFSVWQSIQSSFKGFTSLPAISWADIIGDRFFCFCFTLDLKTADLVVEWH